MIICESERGGDIAGGHSRFASYLVVRTPGEDSEKIILNVVQSTCDRKQFIICRVSKFKLATANMFQSQWLTSELRWR